MNNREEVRRNGGVGNAPNPNFCKKCTLRKEFHYEGILQETS